MIISIHIITKKIFIKKIDSIFNLRKYNRLELLKQEYF